MSQSFPLSQDHIQKCLLIFSAYSILQQKMNYWDHCYLVMPKNITPKAFIWSIYSNIGTVKCKGCEVASVLWPRTRQRVCQRATEGPQAAPPPHQSPELHFIHVSRMHVLNVVINTSLAGAHMPSCACLMHRTQADKTQVPSTTTRGVQHSSHWPCNSQADQDTGCNARDVSQANDKASSRKWRAFWYIQPLF